MNEAKERLIDALRGGPEYEVSDVADAIEALCREVALELIANRTTGTTEIHQMGGRYFEFHAKADPPAGGQRRCKDGGYCAGCANCEARNGPEPQPSAEAKGAKPPGAAKTEPPAIVHVETINPQLYLEKGLLRDPDRYVPSPDGALIIAWRTGEREMVECELDVKQLQEALAQLPEVMAGGEPPAGGPVHTLMGCSSRWCYCGAIKNEPQPSAEAEGAKCVKCETGMGMHGPYCSRKFETQPPTPPSGRLEALGYEPVPNHAKDPFVRPMADATPSAGPIKLPVKVVQRAETVAIEDVQGTIWLSRYAGTEAARSLQQIASALNATAPAEGVREIRAALHNQRMTIASLLRESSSYGTGQGVRDWADRLEAYEKLDDAARAAEGKANNDGE